MGLHCRKHRKSAGILDADEIVNCVIYTGVVHLENYIYIYIYLKVKIDGTDTKR